MGKLVAWGPHATPRPPDLAVAAPGAWKSDARFGERSTNILGSPFGSAEFVHNFGAKLAAKRAKLLSFIPKLPSLQIAWLLL